ncbi:MAG: HAD family hydrolase [Chloroflexi bacterium]|nr:HAD family hydrolase [Chloroflexota bacterium]
MSARKALPPRLNEGNKSASRTLDALIFDLDGTLVDTFPLIIASLQHACEVATGRRHSEAEVVTMFGPTEQDILHTAVGPVRYSVAEHAYYDYYERHHAQYVSVYEGIVRLLDQALHHGYRLALFTGKNHRSAWFTIRATGLEKYFPVVITGDDIEFNKPHPQGIWLALRELGVEAKRAAYVGDMPADIEAGHAAGVRTAGALWHSRFRDEVIACKPDYLFDTVAAMGNWLDGAYLRPLLE